MTPIRRCRISLVLLRCFWGSHSRTWSGQQAGKSHKVMQQQALLLEVRLQTQAEVAISGMVKGTFPMTP